MINIKISNLKQLGERNNKEFEATTTCNQSHYKKKQLVIWEIEKSHHKRKLVT